MSRTQNLYRDFRPLLAEKNRFFVRSQNQETIHHPNSHSVFPKWTGSWYVQLRPRQIIVGPAKERALARISRLYHRKARGRSGCDGQHFSPQTFNLEQEASGSRTLIAVLFCHWQYPSAFNCISRSCKSRVLILRRFCDGDSRVRLFRHLAQTGCADLLCPKRLDQFGVH